MHRPRVKHALIGIGWVVVTLLIALSLALRWTQQAISEARAFSLEPASLYATRALLIVRPLSWLTFKLIPDIELWHEVLTLLYESDELLTATTTVGKSMLQPPALQDQSAHTPFQQFRAQLTTVSNHLTQLNQRCQRSLFIKHWQDCRIFEQTEQFAHDISSITSWLVEDNPTLIVLFQNTEELRATGGFMGSYAKVSFNNGALAELLIEDIYEPDGQFQGYVEAPTGAKEYLSSGRGLRLPDANWHPDFPTSAQTILTYFAFGKERSVDGIVAINSDLIERLLTVTGDIFLPDYGVTVTSSNFTTLARADRDQFFPGSQQKTNFLSHFFNVFKVKLSELTPDQQQQLVSVIQQALVDKTIQLYSTDEEVQKIFSEHQLAGELRPLHQTDQLLYLVESNVGINKANRAVERQVDVNITNQQIAISLHFKNQNQEIGYVDYQRVIVPTDWSLIQDGNTAEVEIISNTQGQQFRQIGFLVTVPAQSSTQVELTFTAPGLTLDNPTLTILKQSGVPPTAYTITTPTKVETIILEKDITLQL